MKKTVAEFNNQQSTFHIKKKYYLHLMNQCAGCPRNTTDTSSGTEWEFNAGTSEKSDKPPLVCLVRPDDRVGRDVEGKGSDNIPLAETQGKRLFA